MDIKFIKIGDYVHIDKQNNSHHQKEGKVASQKENTWLYH
jgi:hypothetical protein